MSNLGSLKNKSSAAEDESRRGFTFAAAQPVFIKPTSKTMTFVGKANPDLLPEAIRYEFNERDASDLMCSPLSFSRSAERRQNSQKRKKSAEKTARNAAEEDFSPFLPSWDAFLGVATKKVGYEIGSNKSQICTGKNESAFQVGVARHGRHINTRG